MPTANKKTAPKISFELLKEEFLKEYQASKAFRIITWIVLAMAILIVVSQLAPLLIAGLIIVVIWLYIKVSKLEDKQKGKK